MRLEYLYFLLLALLSLTPIPIFACPFSDDPGFAAGDPHTPRGAIDPLRKPVDDRNIWSLTRYYDNHELKALLDDIRASGDLPFPDDAHIEDMSIEVSNTENVAATLSFLRRHGYIPSEYSLDSACQFPGDEQKGYSIWNMRFTFGIITCTDAETDILP